MPRQDFDWPQTHVVMQRCASVGEDLVEHPAHGEHGRPGVEPGTADFDFAHLAARGRRTLQHRHLETCTASSRAATSPAIPAPITTTRLVRIFRVPLIPTMQLTRQDQTSTLHYIMY